jgi:hypothetical protein
MQPRRRSSPLMNDISDPPEAQTRCHRRKHARVLSGLLVLVFCSLYYSHKLTEKASKQKAGPRMTFSDQPTALRSKHSRKSPEACWLMSFPNSGTSFTMSMVASASNKSFATNHADEVTASDQPDSLSIYPRGSEGPCWAGLSGKIASPRPLPEKFVLTKTHCGARCVRCGPDEHVETPEIFMRNCASGAGAESCHSRARPNVTFELCSFINPDLGNQ